nr:hypothetical protein [Akkermansiaceae bacterium]
MKLILTGVTKFLPRWMAVTFVAWLFCLFTTSAYAFPPAPYYTLFGIARDQVGQTITAEGAEVVLLKGGKELARTPVTSSQIDLSYELKIRIDQARSGTTIYSERALAASGLFSLAVSMKDPVTKIETWYYPIEVSGNLTAGKGSERVRLDLTLGADLDKDGLPDDWEAWQLYQAGYYQNDNGEWDLTLIDKDGDF